MILNHPKSPIDTWRRLRNGDLDRLLGGVGACSTPSRRTARAASPDCAGEVCRGFGEVAAL